MVRLTIGERVILPGVVDGTRTAKQKSLRAGILLKADVVGPNWTDSQIAEAFEFSGQIFSNRRSVDCGWCCVCV